MESGIGSYKVYIDGKFVLFGLKKGILVIQNPEKVKNRHAGNDAICKRNNRIASMVRDA